jgi:ERCC4-type nuclease
MDLVIDDRERALCAALTVPFLKERLCLADVVIVGGGTVQLAVERKTVADLTASLNDGRFHEQRARLLEAYGHERTAYMIEGPFDMGALPAECGALHALVFRDRVPVLRTRDVAETALVLVKLLSLAEEGRLAHRALPPCDVSRHLKAKRMPTASARDAMVSMLCTIPSMSPVKASAVASAYGSLGALCAALNTDRQTTVAALGDVQCGSVRLGKVMANKVAVALVAP